MEGNGLPPRISTAFFLEQVVTTNWDTFFEEYSGATPIVVPEDYAFWDVPGRKVFKLHGSMHNLGTIVATAEDYEKCYRRLRDGVVGASLRHLLATKQVVFIGYSFSDSDLNRILRFLKKELADVIPRSYVVSPHGYAGTDFAQDRVIQTDGAYFIQMLKEAAVALGRMRPDSVYESVRIFRGRVREAHLATAREFIKTANPAIVHCLSYQDGLLHALDRIEAFESSGRYSDPHANHGMLPTYMRAFRGAVRKREYYDASYIDGYINGMLTLELSPKEMREIPTYRVWGSAGDLTSLRAFQRSVRQAAALHKAATAQAVRYAKNLHKNELLASHAPFVDVSGYADVAR